MTKKNTAIQAVVFDLFGVLIGGHRIQDDRWRYVSEQLGMDRQSLTDFLVANDSYQQMQDGKISQETWWGERMNQLGIEKPRQTGLFDQLFNRWSANPYCIELIEQLLARGTRLALLSNSSGPTSSLIKEHPFLADFDAIILSGEIAAGKPTRIAFRAVEKALSLPPSRLLFTDDAKHNIFAARHFGWHAHHFQSVDLLRIELEAWSLL